MVRPISHIFSYTVFALLLLGVSLTHTSCDGDNKDPLELGPYYLYEWLDYIYFKEGTWWVYESTHDGTTVYDTVTVLSSILDTLRWDNGGPGSWKITKQYVSYDAHSSRSGAIYYRTSTPGLLDAVDTVPYGRFSLERNVWQNGICYPMFAYSKNFLEKGTGSTSTTFDGMKDGIEISGNVYNDVAVFSVSDDFAWDHDNRGPPAKYYWVKGIGIVKRESDYLREEWHLVDYHIVQ